MAHPNSRSGSSLKILQVQQTQRSLSRIILSTIRIIYCNELDNIANQNMITSLFTHQSNRQQQLLSKTRAESLANFRSLNYWKVDVIRIQTHLIGNNEHKCRNQIFWINHLCCCSSILPKWYRNLKTFYKVENFNEFGKTEKIKKSKLIQIELE